MSIDIDEMTPFVCLAFRTVFVTTLQIYLKTRKRRYIITNLTVPAKMGSVLRYIAQKSHEYNNTDNVGLTFE